MRHYVCFCILCLVCGRTSCVRRERMWSNSSNKSPPSSRDNELAEAEKELTCRLTSQHLICRSHSIFMGTIRAKQGRLNEAELLFLRAVRNDKKFTGARMNLVYLYLLKRAPEKSIVQLKEILAVEPEHAEAT